MALRGVLALVAVRTQFFLIHLVDEGVDFAIIEGLGLQKTKELFPILHDECLLMRLEMR